jgi:hypothetical protein
LDVSAAVQWLRAQAGWHMTMTIRQWSAKGGPIVLGRVIPAIVAGLGLVALTASIVMVQEHGWREASVPSGLLIFITLLAVWLAWRFLRTAWLIVLVDDTFTCYATSGSWTLGPGEVRAVRGDAYNQLLHIEGTPGRISVWGGLENRESLFTAIREANPSVEFAPWILHSE